MVACLFGVEVPTVASLRRFCYIDGTVITSYHLLEISSSAAGLDFSVALGALGLSIGEVLVEELLYDLVFGVMN